MAYHDQVAKSLYKSGVAMIGLAIDDAEAAESTFKCASCHHVFEYPEWMEEMLQSQTFDDFGGAGRTNISRTGTSAVVLIADVTVST